MTVLDAIVRAVMETVILVTFAVAPASVPEQPQWTTIQTP